MKESLIDVLGEYKFSKIRVSKHGHEAKAKTGWKPIPEWLFDEADAAGVPELGL